MNSVTLTCRRSLAALCAAGALLTLLPGATPGRAAGAEVRWTTDYKAARELSKKSGKPILMEFYADWCGPCKQMEQTTFKDAQVVKLTTKFIPVRINIDKNQALAHQYDAMTIPRAVILSPAGKVTRISAGYRDPDAFMLFLKQGL